MKATGMIRRVDDLGRVVIPKEVRRTLGIREGDALEIYTTQGDEVIFKKYNPTFSHDLSNYANSIEEVLRQNDAPVEDRRKAKNYLTELVKILEHYE